MFVGLQKISHNYRRPTNLQEADVFSHVCLSMEGRGTEGISCDHHPWCIVPHCTGNPLVPAPSSRYRTLPQVWIWGGPGGLGPLDPRFWGPKIEHFWALFNFSTIFFASLHLAYYFFNILLFHSSNSKIFQPCYAHHMISHLQVFVFGLSFIHLGHLVYT